MNTNNRYIVTFISQGLGICLLLLTYKLLVSAEKTRLTADAIITGVIIVTVCTFIFGVLSWFQSNNTIKWSWLNIEWVIFSTAFADILPRAVNCLHF